MILAPPLWATGAWVANVWADGTWAETWEAITYFAGLFCQRTMTGAGA